MKAISASNLHGLLATKLFDESSVGIAVVGVGGVLKEVNPALCRYLGYSRRELLAKRMCDVTHPDDLPACLRKIEALRTGQKRAQTIEKRFLHKSGRIRWAVVTVSRVHTRSGQGALIVAEVMDTSALKKAEDELRDSEMRRRSFYEGIIDGFAHVDMTGRLQEFNRSFMALLGYEKRSELKRLSFHAFTPAKWHALEEGIVRDQVMVRGYSEVYQKEYIRKDGSIIPVELRAYLVRDPGGNPVGMWAMVRDISAQLRMQRALRQSHGQLERKVRERTLRLRKLAGELSQAEHKERRRIAQVLHEDLQQRLVAMKYQAQDMAGFLMAEGGQRRLPRLLEEMDQAIQITRTLSSDLCPPVLYDLGLGAALEWLATDLKKRLGLVIATDVAAGARLLSDDLRIFAFEAVRELLLNVAKHAGVKSVMIQVASGGRHAVRVTVVDKGKGFDARRQIHEQQKFGLFSIQERARSFGGRLTVVSRPGQGTRATIVLPRR